MRFMDGNATPAARPNSARTTRRVAAEWPAAHGVRRVKKDHKATPHAITVFPPYLSANAPPITEENM